MSSEILAADSPLARYYDSALPLVGRTESRTLGLVDAVSIGRYALTIGSSDPIHFDPEAARAAGYPDVVAPPNMLAAIFEWGIGTPESKLKNDGTPPRVTGGDRELRGMGAGEEMELLNPVIAGMQIELDEVLESVLLKQTRSGPCLFVTTAHNFKNAEGTVLNRNKKSVVLRNPHEETV